jgi:hypothetical protein
LKKPTKSSMRFLMHKPRSSFYRKEGRKEGQQ